MTTDRSTAPKNLQHSQVNNGFTHTTSSPHYPQSNGLAERTVQTAKGLLKESTDPHLALLTYRATPLPWCNLSPAELLMGRKLRTNVPATTTSLVPQWEFLATFREKDRERKVKQKQHYDQRHRTRPLPEIPNNSAVWINTGGNSIPGQIVTQSTTPRSYLVQTPSGTLRRNRSQINPAPNSQTSPSQPTAPTPADRDPIMTRSRTGTARFPPQRLT